MALTINKIPAEVNHPQFLKFLDYYIKVFLSYKWQHLGRWIKEYTDMKEKGLFTPKIMKVFFIKMLANKCQLDFQRQQVIWFIGNDALDATKLYIDEHVNALYNICVITGELAYDDDDDPYTNLTYEEAIQIAKMLNEEAEEELFIIKRI